MSSELLSEKPVRLAIRAVWHEDFARVQSSARRNIERLFHSQPLPRRLSFEDVPLLIVVDCFFVLFLSTFGRARARAILLFLCFRSNILK